MNRIIRIEITDKSQNLEALAAALSLKYPQLYITIERCFNPIIIGRKRLEIESPDNSIRPYYWLNGKRKAFTDTQIIKSQNAYLNAIDK